MRSALAQLVEYGLLLRKDSAEARQDTQDRKGMVRLVATRELSFLYKGRRLRRPQQLELGSAEGCPAEDATA